MKTKRREIKTTKSVFDELTEMGVEKLYRTVAISEVVERALDAGDSDLSDFVNIDSDDFYKRLPFAISIDLDRRVNDFRINLPDGCSKDFKTAYNALFYIGLKLK